MPNTSESIIVHFNISPLPVEELLTLRRAMSGVKHSDCVTFYTFYFFFGFSSRSKNFGKTPISAKNAVLCKDIGLCLLGFRWRQFSTSLKNSDN